MFTDSPGGPGGPSGPVRTFPLQFSRQYCSDNSSPRLFVSFLLPFLSLNSLKLLCHHVFLEISAGRSDREKKILLGYIEWYKKKSDCVTDVHGCLFLHERRADEGRLEAQPAGGADSLHWPPTKIM